MNSTFLKRVLIAVAFGLLSVLAHAANSPLMRVSGTITTQNLVPAGACTTGGCVEVDVATAGAVTVQVTGTYTASGGLSAQVTTNGTTWVTLGSSSAITRQSTGVAAATITSAQQDIYQVAVAGARRFRITALGAVTGTATVAIQPVELSLGSASSGGGGGGDATEATLQDIEAAIGATNTQLPATLGVKTAAGSMSVTLASDDAKFSATATADAGRLPVDQRDVLAVASASVTSATTIWSADTTGYGSLIVNVTAVGSGTITFQTAEDSGFTTPLSVSCMQQGASSSVSGGYAGTTTAVSIWRCPVTQRYFRVQVTAYTSGTFTSSGTLRKDSPGYPLHYAFIANNVTVSASGGTGEGSAVTAVSPVQAGLEARTASPTIVTNGQAMRLKGTTIGALIVRQDSIPELEWIYAAATSGIVNTTTAVTIKAATGSASTRSYVKGCTLAHDTLGGATELAIRDGAGGTVIWRTKLQTTALAPIHLPIRVKSTLNTLLEVVTLSAVTGGVYVSCDGYDAP